MEDENELVNIKKELKCWESMFARKYGRKPGKEDINQSSEEIKDSYKRYAYLKCKKPDSSAAITPVQKQDEEKKDNGVFGKSLNKKPKKPPERICHFKKESCEWRPKLKLTKLTKREIVESAENNDVGDVENENLTSIQISTPDQTMVTPPNRRTIGSIRKKSSSSARFKHISQDLLNTCQDFLNKFEDTPLKRDYSEPVSEGNPEPVLSSDISITGSNNTTNGTVLKEMNIMPNTFLPSENYQDDFSGVNDANFSNGNRLTSSNTNNDTSIVDETNTNTITNVVTNLFSMEGRYNSNITEKCANHSDSLVIPTSTSATNFPVGTVKIDTREINHSNVSDFDVSNTNDIEPLSRHALKNEENVTKYADEMSSNKLKHQPDNDTILNTPGVDDIVDFSMESGMGSECKQQSTTIPRSIRTAKARATRTNTNDVSKDTDELNSLPTKPPIKGSLKNPMSCKSDAIEDVYGTVDVFNFNGDSEINTEEKQESVSIPSGTKSKARSKRSNKKKESEVTYDEEQSEKVVATKTKRKRVVDAEETGTNSNKKVKRTKVVANAGSDLLSTQEGNEDTSLCEESCTKTGNDNEEINKKVKKVPSKKAAAKTNKLVSENFVKIDISKKTYVRGVKKMTGAQMKRNEWKKKTAFERPIKVSKTGKSICFKCGGEGHWAKFCKERFKKKTNPFSNVDEEKDSMEFQHLNEAGGSGFDYHDADGNVDNNGFCKQVNFTIDDVLKVEPCWPRIPYNTSEFQKADTLPLFEPVDGKPSPESYENVTACLRTFGYESFREGQLESTARILSGLSTLVILSTGSGKSLCYQLPAYKYYKEKGWITIVISPLIALMQDQVGGLPSCLPGACLNGNMTKLQKERVVTKLKEGKLAVLLVSPETLVSGGFGYGMLPPKFSLPPIAFACIDEAHCLSEWSHNFRPSYLKVCKVLQDRYNIKCLLGLTATASLATAKSVIHHLGIKSEGSIIRDPHPVPQNLCITASRDDNRDQALLELLQIAPFTDCDSIIVYTTRRTETERLAEKLRTCLPDRLPTEKDEEAEAIEKKKQKKKTKVTARKKAKPFWWNVECYHAGLTPAERKRVQNDFMSGELRIVVATVAFGMGLDKSDVRSVIHYNMPKSFENYVQEIGRAGRDGKPAFCHVFLSEESGDLNEIRRHIYASSIDRRTVEKFIDLVFPPCRCLELNKKHISPQENENEGNVKNNRELLHSTENNSLPMNNFAIGNGAFDCDDTMQSMSDGEMELLFSEQFDAEFTENVEDMESQIDANTGETENHKDRTALTNIDSEIAKYCDTTVNQSNCENIPDVKCDEANLVQSANDSETVKCKELIQSSTECTDNSNNTKSEENNYNLNYCSGHRICISIDDTIADLDMPEENIATLMSYLELHPKKWLEVLNPLRAFCTVKCYGGPEQFQLLAKKFHPVALAVRNFINDDARKLSNRREIDFNFGDVADLMCWDVITVAREVRSLQWNMDFALVKDNSEKSGIIVECETLSFHVVTSEGIDDDEKDEISNFLHGAVLKQEETRLLQLDALYTSLRQLSSEYYWQIRPEIRVDVHVRKCIVNYFMSDEEGQIAILQEMCGPKVEEVVPDRRWNAIANDIRTILVCHPDQTFTGRAIARIFHGIGSPCFPAINFGRDRRFWRVYLDVDFNELRIFATKTISHLKGINVKH